MYNSDIYFTLIIGTCMVTKMADKIGLKLRNCHFAPNLRILETDFLSLRIRYQQKRIPKIKLLICCVPC